MNTSVYEPDYIFLLLIFLGIIYLIYLALVISKVKLDTLTTSTLAISFLTYLLVGFYMIGKGYYVDGNAPIVFHDLGFLELILLTYPYVFLALAASLGEKRKI
jgi:hypothetical membrane protein